MKVEYIGLGILHWNLVFYIKILFYIKINRYEHGQHAVNISYENGQNVQIVLKNEKHFYPYV